MANKPPRERCLVGSKGRREEKLEMRGYRDNWHYVIPIQSPWYERLTPLWATGDLIALVLELVGIVLWSVSGPISLIVAAIGLGIRYRWCDPVGKIGSYPDHRDNQDFRPRGVDGRNG